MKSLNLKKIAVLGGLLFLGNKFLKAQPKDTTTSNPPKNYNPDPYNVNPYTPPIVPPNVAQNNGGVVSVKPSNYSVNTTMPTNIVGLGGIRRKRR